MAKKKSETTSAKPATATINFRCPADIKRGLEMLVFINQYKDLSELLVEMCGKLVAANRRQIANVEQSRARNPMREPTYEIASSKTAAQIDAGDVTLKGGDADENP